MSETLVLSQGYQPVAVVPWQKAITLLFLGKIEIVREYEDRNLRSTHMVIKMPAVVRLLNAFKKRPNRVKFNRANIYARDKYKCQYCGSTKLIKELTFDHVVPRTQGGKTTWENIVSSCNFCNLKKGGRTPEQAGMPLLTKPVKPKYQPSLHITVSKRSVPDAWRDFLYWTGELDE